MLFLFHFAEISNFYTDLLFAAVLYLFGQKISDFEGNNQLFKAWKIYFLLTGLSAFIAAFGHLLSNYFGMNLKMCAWVIGLVSLFFLEKETLKLFNFSKHINYILFFKLFIFSYLAIHFQLFTFIKIAITIGMVGIVCPALIYFYQKNNEKSYLFVMLWLLGNALAGIAHALNLQVGDWLNGGDIAHLISCICFWRIYQELYKINNSLAIAKK